MCDDPRLSLPDANEIDNEPVFCERCQRNHRQMTRQDYDAIVLESAKRLANAIDRDIFTRVMVDLASMGYEVVQPRLAGRVSDRNALLSDIVATLERHAHV